MAALCGILSLLIGLAAILGWHLKILALVNIAPSLPAMAYAAALCFVFGGSGLAAYALRLPRFIPLASGLLIALFAWAWCLEYLLGFTLGIKAVETRFPSIPGVPFTTLAPAAAICFAFLGVALAALGLRSHATLRRLVIWVCGSLSLAPFTMLVGSYLTGFMDFKDWQNFNVMAFNTLFAMMLLGIGIFAALVMHGPRLTDDPLLPIPVFLIIAGATFIFWLALLADHDQTIRRESKEAARFLANTSLLHIKAPIRALERMKLRWEHKGGTPYAEWTLDAAAHVDTEKIFAAIEWVDPSGIVAWSWPESQKNLGLDIRRDSRWHAAPALDAALLDHSIVLSPTIELRQGGTGFLVYLPLFPNGKFDGWLLGVIRLNYLMRTAIDGINLADETASIFEDDRLVIGPPAPANAPSSEYLVGFHGHRWRFVVTPMPGKLSGHGLPLISLVFGLLLATALSGTVFTLQKITSKNRQIRIANRRLERYANEDYLTGLFNRRHFDELLENELRRARRQRRPLSLVMADVDFFKRYNDRYGHLAGDECLRKVAAAIQASLHRPADAAGRFGGEEFCALLPETDPAGAHAIADSIRSAIESLHLPHELNPHGRVTASLGVATATSPITPADLIAAADKALYLAKESGRNTVR